MHPNTFSVSLACLIIKSLSVDLQTLLNFLKTCKGCYEMLESLKFPWKVAVEQEFRGCYRDLDITSWIQTRDCIHHALCKTFVSALHRPSNKAAQGITLCSDWISLYVNCAISCPNAVQHTNLTQMDRQSHKQNTLQNTTPDQTPAP